MVSKESEKIKYPPFPPVPPNTTIIPFADFKETGIRILGLPFGNDFNEDDHLSNGIEVDGLGIPTIALRHPHNTDVCKTNTRRKDDSEARKALDKKEKEKEERKRKEAEDKEKRKDKDMLKKMDPIERAQELRRRRLVLFAKQEWYELWKDGEHLRGTKVYDSNMPIIDRIHLASTEFRTGRTWPPASTRVGYLWDQFRLFAGLLGSPPIWYRTDLQQEPGDVLDDTGDYDDDPISAPVSSSSPNEQERKAAVISDDEFEGDDEFEEQDSKRPTAPKESQIATNQDPMEQKRKRVPARTPYALYQFDPVPVKSEAEVKTLIRLASLRKHAKLLAFLSEPELSTKIFLSWYARKEGLVWSHAHLNALPRLLVFFLELLVRTKAIPESDRSLRKAVEVAKLAVNEVPKTWKLCRNLPDKVGVGCRGIWGTRWIEEPFKFAMDEAQTADEKEKQEAMKKFEEELKADNIQMFSAKKNLSPQLNHDSDDDKDESIIGTPAMSATEIPIQVTSPTSTVFVELDRPSYIEEVVANAEKLDRDEEPSAPPSSQPPQPHVPQGNEASLLANDPETERIPWRWDKDETSASSTAEDEQARLDSWAPPRIQPLVDLFGMSVFPLQYEPGLAERSTRRVRGIVAPGEKVREKDSLRNKDKESSKKSEEWMDRKWKGVQEEMVDKLTRVVLEPWNGFDDGGCADDYRVPKVQVPERNQKTERDASSEEGDIFLASGKNPIENLEEHNPERDTIVVLMEPRVAELLCIGMGLSGTWVQIVRKRHERSDSGRGGRGGYHGRGRGRGRGRGGPPGAPITALSSEKVQPAETNIVEVEALKTISGPVTTSNPAMPEPHARGGRGGGRGRGRGYGGHFHGGDQQYQKDFIFWYVEELFMAVPSFWTVGKEDEPLKLPDNDEDNDGDDVYPDDLED